jgi:prepilin-type N-terminal cleavage/methylation domain-containing protein
LSRRPTHPGFTLIEVLIAVTMIVLITGMMYGSYAATTQSLTRYDARSACRKRTDIVLRLLTRQIRGAFAPAPQSGRSKVADPSSEPVFRGNGENPQGEFLTFLTTAGSSTGGTAAATLVSTSYRYDAATGSLSIRQSPRVGRLTGGNTVPWTTILNHVDNLQVEFYDGARWRSQWDDRQLPSTKLPRAVRIALTVSDECSGSYQTQTTIPVVSRIATGTHGAEAEEATGKL